MKPLSESWQFATPPQLAKYLAIDVIKVHRWIQAGELSAANIATRLDGRPVFRISRQHFESFWASRSASFIKPERNPAPVRRARRKSVKSYV